MYQNCIFQNLKYPLVYIALVEMRIIMSDSITKIEYTVPEEESGSRLDQFLTKKQPDISRSFLQKKIKEGKVLVNDKKAKAGLKLTKIISFFIMNHQKNCP